MSFRATFYVIIFEIFTQKKSSRDKLVGFIKAYKIFIEKINL